MFNGAALPAKGWHTGCPEVIPEPCFERGEYVSIDWEGLQVTFSSADRVRSWQRHKGHYLSNSMFFLFSFLSILTKKKQGDSQRSPNYVRPAC